MLRVRRDDQVVLLSGKNRGKRGKVLRVMSEVGRVTVEGLNLVKRTTRRSQQNPQGGIISREAPVPLDRVMPVCPKCNRGVRIGSKLLPDGTKTRICRRCQETF